MDRLPLGGIFSGDFSLFKLWDVMILTLLAHEQQLGAGLRGSGLIESRGARRAEWTSVRTHRGTKCFGTKPWGREPRALTLFACMEAACRWKES
jgi:hypothetical protein